MTPPFHRSVTFHHHNLTVQEKSPTEKFSTTQQPVLTHGGLLHARLPVALQLARKIPRKCPLSGTQSISGPVAEYVVAINVTRVRFLADAFSVRRRRRRIA